MVAQQFAGTSPIRYSSDVETRSLPTLWLMEPIAMVMRGDNWFYIGTMQDHEGNLQGAYRQLLLIQIHGTPILAPATILMGAKLEVITTSTTAPAGYFYINTIHTGSDSNSAVSIFSDHVSATGQVLRVRGDGSGNLLTLNQGGTDRLVVQADGQVGIGTTDPDQLLHVRKDQNTDTLIKVQNNTAGTLARAGLWLASNSNNAYVIVADDGYTAVADWADTLILNSNAGAGIRFACSSATKMAILADGNVGVGEASPDMRLHVKNTINTAFSVANSVLEAKNLFKLENASTTANAFAGMQFRIGSGCDLFFGAEQKTGNDGDFYFANQGSPSTEIMRIKSTGKVGIGTDPDTPLHVYSGDNDVLKIQGGDHVRVLIDGTDSSEKSLNFSEAGSLMWKLGMDNIAPFEAFVIKNNDNGAPQFVIDHSTGNVGIGTTNPGYLLHLEDADSDLLKLKSTGSGSSNAPRILFEHNGGGTQSADIVFDQSQQNTLKFTTYYESGSDLNRIQFAPANSVALTICGGTNGAGKDGFVGIGTDAPNHRLTVRESGEAKSGSNVDISNLALQIIKPLDVDGGAVGFGLGSSTTETNIGGAMIFERLGSNSYGKLHFATKSATTASTDIPIRMTIANDGKVGIGTTAPHTPLDVVATGTESDPTLQVGYASNAARDNYRMAFYTDSETGYISNKNGNNGIRFRHRSNTIMQVGYGGACYNALCWHRDCCARAIASS